MLCSEAAALILCGHAPSLLAVALVEEVEKALKRQPPVRLVLAHEQRPDQGSVSFDTIIRYTPQQLKGAGIYDKMARAIHSGAHQEVSVRLLLMEIAGETAAVSSPSMMAAHAALSCFAWPAKCCLERRTSRAIELIELPDLPSLTDGTLGPICGNSAEAAAPSV